MAIYKTHGLELEKESRAAIYSAECAEPCLNCELPDCRYVDTGCERFREAYERAKDPAYIHNGRRGQDKR